MGMVVDLGLERFFYNEPEARVAAVTKLVADGYTTCLREVLTERRGEYGDARVFEARREGDEVVTRWLEGKERARITGDIVKTVAKTGSSASFSWDEAEELDLDVRRLAFRLDGPVPAPAWRGVDVKGVGCDVYDLELSASNYKRRRHPELKAAAGLHVLALAHRLLIHSA